MIAGVALIHRSNSEQAAGDLRGGQKSLDDGLAGAAMIGIGASLPLAAISRLIVPTAEGDRDTAHEIDALDHPAQLAAEAACATRAQARRRRGRDGGVAWDRERDHIYAVSVSARF